MIQLNAKPATPITHRTRQSALPLLIASALFAFANAVGAEGAGIVANGSGSLLTAADAGTQTAAVGALTLNRFDSLVSTTTAPVSSFYSPSASSILHREEAMSFTNVTRVPEPTTWLAALLAAGASLFLARIHLARRRLVPVQNT